MDDPCLCLSILQALDAVDNGIDQFASDQPPRYVNNTHLSARVGRLNPDWLADNSSEAENAAFAKAVAATGAEFVEVSPTWWGTGWLELGTGVRIQHQGCKRFTGC